MEQIKLFTRNVVIRDDVPSPSEWESFESKINNWILKNSAVNIIHKDTSVCLIEKLSAGGALMNYTVTLSYKTTPKQ